MVFKKDKERDKAASLIKDEAKKMSTLFLRLSHAANAKVLADSAHCGGVAVPVYCVCSILK
jgi:hypothetical protein